MDLELGVAQFGKKLLPHTPTQELYTLSKVACKGLPCSMYRGLEGVQGELLLKKFPLHVLS